MFVSPETFQFMLELGLPNEKLAELFHRLHADHNSVQPTARTPTPEEEAAARKRMADRERMRTNRMSRDSRATVARPLEKKVSPTPPSKTQNPVPPSPPKGGSSPKANGFDRFWEAYPRKVGKGAARKAYDRAASKLQSEDRAPLATMLAALERVIPTWDDPEFIPHASTWLNGERWDDEPELPPPKATPGADYARHLPLQVSESLDDLKARLDAELGSAA